MEYVKISGDNVVIEIPIKALVDEFNNDRYNKWQGIKVKQRNEFAQGVAQILDDIFFDLSIYGVESVSEFNDVLLLIFATILDNKDDYKCVKFPKVMKPIDDYPIKGLE
ncbi:hypothetical protein [Metabacillus schmidteae]|uniref:hypothetical protein n=1 Tax=Metabacillus schmidteae TaxID=2730405 RepID=UPI0015897A0E|nr:hypothetical protein [Metabacillus schmidteae]